MHGKIHIESNWPYCSYLRFNCYNLIWLIILENAILVADGGDFVATAAYNLHPRSAGSWLDPGAFGTLGVGGGFALGAKLVRPESEVWIIYGDGSCGYSIAEIDTFTRHKVLKSSLY